MKIKDGVENWQILQALVNGTKPLGLGIYDPRGHEPMSDADAKAFCMGRETGGRRKARCVSSRRMRRRMPRVRSSLKRRAQW